MVYTHVLRPSHVIRLLVCPWCYWGQSSDVHTECEVGRREISSRSTSCFIVFDSPTEGRWVSVQRRLFPVSNGGLYGGWRTLKRDLAGFHFHSSQRTSRGLLLRWRSAGETSHNRSQNSGLLWLIFSSVWKCWSVAFLRSSPEFDALNGSQRRSIVVSLFKKASQRLFSS